MIVLAGSSTRVPSMAKLKFKDVVICRAERFSVGVEEASGKFYVAIPVSNSPVDYEEYYQIDHDAFARYKADPKAALGFVSAAAIAKRTSI